MTASDTENTERVAQALLRARREGRCADAEQFAAALQHADQAYAVQAIVARSLGWQEAGAGYWKSGGASRELKLVLVQAWLNATAKAGQTTIAKDADAYSKTIFGRMLAEQATDARQHAEVTASVSSSEIPEPSPIRAVGIDGLPSAGRPPTPPGWLV